MILKHVHMFSLLAWLSMILKHVHILCFLYWRGFELFCNMSIMFSLLAWLSMILKHVNNVFFIGVYFNDFETCKYVFSVGIAFNWLWNMSINVFFSSMALNDFETCQYVFLICINTNCCIQKYTNTHAQHGHNIQTHINFDRHIYVHKTDVLYNVLN